MKSLLRVKFIFLALSVLLGTASVASAGGFNDFGVMKAGKGTVTTCGGHEDYGVM